MRQFMVFARACAAVLAPTPVRAAAPPSQSAMAGVQGGARPCAPAGREGVRAFNTLTPTCGPVAATVLLGQYRSDTVVGSGLLDGPMALARQAIHLPCLPGGIRHVAAPQTPQQVERRTRAGGGPGQYLHGL
jgi:hypothetical protein